MIKTLLILFSVFLVYTGIFAARPLSTDDIETVESGKYELEYGFVISEDETCCEISFKHGLTDKMDIGLVVPYQIRPRPEEPFGVCSLCLKFHVIRDIFSFSVTNELGSTAYRINTIFSRKLGPVLLHFNVGYKRPDKSTGKITHSIAIEKSFWKFNIVGEVLEFKDYLFGLRYHLLENFVIDIAYGNTPVKITTGLRYEF